MKKKILFIINPISGDIKKANVPEQIEQYLNKDLFDSEIRYTERAGHAKFIALEAVENGVEVVVAVGGDGSINEVAQSLVGSKTILGIVPLGSGNGLATHLELPIRNVRKAIEVINNQYEFKMDVGHSNLGYFVSCAGEGLDAAVARTYRHQSIRGFFSYFLAVNKEVLFLYKHPILEFDVNGSTFTEEVMLFSVFNARYYGYNVGIYPKASIQDGLLNAVVIKKCSWWRLPFVIFMGLIGKIESVKEATVYTSDKIVIRNSEKRVVQLDGDSLMTSSNFELSVLPNALTVYGQENIQL